jgi:hypothetical protein
MWKHSYTFDVRVGPGGSDSQDGGHHEAAVVDLTKTVTAENLLIMPNLAKIGSYVIMNLFCLKNKDCYTQYLNKLLLRYISKPAD